MSKYDELTDLVRGLTDDKREACVGYWRDWHEEENDDLLTDDLMCQCCGVDYSGFDRDLLAADGSETPYWQESRAFWMLVSETMKG